MSRFFGGKRQGKYYYTGEAGQPAAPEREARSDPSRNPVYQDAPSRTTARKDRRSPRNRVRIPSKDQVVEARTALERKKIFRQALSSTVSVLLVVAAVAVLVATLFLPVLQISGTSMEPTPSSPPTGAFPLPDSLRIWIRWNSATASPSPSWTGC